MTSRTEGADPAPTRRRWFIYGLIGFVVLLVLISVLNSGSSDLPYADPPPDVIEFSVTREWEPPGGLGAAFRIDDSATKEQVVALGRWLLRTDAKVLFHIDNSKGRLAVVGNLFEEGSISWFEGGQVVEVILEGGQVTQVERKASMDMPFDELQTFAMRLEYQDLYRNMDKYSIGTWRETGGDTPLIYLEGQVDHVEALTGLLEGVWSGLLNVGDDNSLVFNFREPPLIVGDTVEFIGVCEDVRSFELAGGGTITTPFCIAWQVRTVK